MLTLIIPQQDHAGLIAQARGLQAETVRAADLRRVTAEEAAHLLGIPDVPCGGILIPYPATSGYCRVRLDEPWQAHGWDKPAKYLAPKGERNRLYIPPNLPRHVLEGTDPLIVTEGEFKALRANEAGIHCIATAGIWSWKQRGPDGEKLTDEDGLLDDFRKLRWADRKLVVLCYDSDIGPGHPGYDAYDRLARQLDRLGARRIKLVTLPSLLDGAKTGLDDFLSRKSARDFWRLVNEQPDWSPTRSGAHSEGEDPWPPRGELPSERPPAPSLPPEMLPDPIRGWLIDVAERACIPLEYVTAPALIALGALVGRRVGIRPEQYDDWTVVPNLWGGIVGRPGLLKSHAIAEALRPLRRLAADATERHEAEADGWTARGARLQAEIEAIKAQMTKKAKAGRDASQLEAALVEKLAEAREAAPTERRYYTQDATIEKLGELLKQNPQGLLILRDELAGWLRTLDKPGREGDREFYLEAWNGTGSFTVDRIERGTLHIRALCLSVVGGIQPGKLAAYISDSLREGFRDDGLLQRLQVLVWPDRPGEWAPVKRWPDTPARQRAMAVFSWLDTLSPAAIGAQLEDEAIPYLRFDPPAQAVWDAWRAELEARLRSEELAATPAFEAHLAKYRSLMPSLALIFHLVDAASRGGTSGAVGEDAARLAAAWCDYLEHHAKKVYAEEILVGVAAARRLAAHIEAGHIRDGDTVRDIYRYEWAGLSTPELVAAGLKVLAEIGWIREVRVTSGRSGGRPSYIVRLHPELRQGVSSR